jgi:cytochrome d ubiquinol oxidase subunit II
MILLWFLLILLCIGLYVTLDGYDLGIGIATLFERDAQHRRQMLELVAVAWDGNETWLVLTGVALWAGFPLGFGTILPHAYLVLIVMLLALIVRGVSVEMVSQKPPAPGWEKAFGIASLAAALAQGLAAGTLAMNLTITSGTFSGSAFGSLGWFPALTAVAVAGGYLAMGYAYIKWKTAGDLRSIAGRRGYVSVLVASVLAVVCLCAVNATAAPLELHDPAPAIAFAWLLLFAAGGIGMMLAGLKPGSRYERYDFLSVVGYGVAVVALLLAVVVARYPVLIPPSLTVADAASPDRSLTFLAVGIGLDLPLILFYSWYAHHAFRGKQDGIPEADTPTPATPTAAQSISAAATSHQQARDGQGAQS